MKLGVMVIAVNLLLALVYGPSWYGLVGVACGVGIMFVGDNERTKL